MKKNGQTMNFNLTSLVITLFLAAGYVLAYAESHESSKAIFYVQ